MAKKRLHRTIAVLVGSLVVPAIFPGLARLNAAQLEVDQQFLDQAIDRLAADGRNPGPGMNFSIDQTPAAPTSDVSGSFPGSILLPGTNTSIRVYGEIGEVLGYGLSGGNLAGSR